MENSETPNAPTEKARYKILFKESQRHRPNFENEIDCATRISMFCVMYHIHATIRSIIPLPSHSKLQTASCSCVTETHPLILSIHHTPRISLKNKIQTYNIMKPIYRKVQNITHSHSHFVDLSVLEVGVFV